MMLLNLETEYQREQYKVKAKKCCDYLGEKGIVISLGEAEMLIREFKRSPERMQRALSKIFTEIEDIFEKPPWCETDTLNNLDGL